MHSSQYIVHITQNTEHKHRTQNTVHSTQITEHRTQNTEHRTQYTVQTTKYQVHRTQYTINSKKQIVQITDYRYFVCLSVCISICVTGIPCVSFLILTPSVPICLLSVFYPSSEKCLSIFLTLLNAYLTCVNVI